MSPTMRELPDDGAVLISAARFLEDPEALSRRAGQDRRDLAEQPRRRRSRAVSRPARGGRAGVSDLPRRPRLQPGAAVARALSAIAASCAPPGRCCATSSCSCCAPASTRSRSRSRATRRRSPTRSSAIRCSTSRPAMAASPRCTGGCSCAIRKVPASECACTVMRSCERLATICRRPRSSIARFATRRPAEVIAAALQAVGRERLAVVSSFGTEFGRAAQGDGRCRSRDSRDLSRYRLAVRGDAGLSRHADRDAWACAMSVRSSRWKRRCRARIRIASCGSPIPMPAAGSARSSRWRARWRRSAPGSTGASAFRAARAPNSRWSRQDGAQAEIQSVRQRLARRDRGDLHVCKTAAASARGIRVICRSAACPAPAGPRRMKMRAPAAGAAGPRRNAASIRSTTS